MCNNCYTDIDEASLFVGCGNPATIVEVLGVGIGPVGWLQVLWVIFEVTANTATPAETTVERFEGCPTMWTNRSDLRITGGSCDSLFRPGREMGFPILFGRAIFVCSVRNEVGRLQ